MLPFLLGHFGKQILGLYVFIQSIHALADFVNNAIGMALTRHVAETRQLRDYQRLNSIVNGLWMITFCANVVVALALVCIGKWGLSWFAVPDRLVETARITCYVFGLINILNGGLIGFDGVMIGLQKIHERNMFLLIGMAMRLISMIAVIALDLSLAMYVLLLGLSSLTVRLLVVQYLRSVFPQMHWNPRECICLAELRKAIGFSACQILNRASDLLMYNMDKLIIQRIMGPMFVLTYDIANRPHLACQQFISLPLSALIPACSAAYARGDRHFLDQMLVKGTRVYLSLVLPVILAGILSMRPFIELWMGAEYAIAIPCAQLFLTTCLVGCPFKVLSHMMVAKSRIAEYAATKFCYALINVPLSIYCVLRWGIIGGVLVTSIYWSVVYVLTNLYVLRIERIHITRLAKALVPFLGMVLLEYLLLSLLLRHFYHGTWLTLVIVTGLACIVGMGACYLFILDASERSQLLMCMLKRGVCSL